MPASTEGQPEGIWGGTLSSSVEGGEDRAISTLLHICSRRGRYEAVSWG